MVAKSTVWAVRLGILFATCLGVFVLPFYLPHAYFQGVSASNLAGFNNRIASISAACMGTLVFLLCLRWPEIAGSVTTFSAIDRKDLDKNTPGLSTKLVFAVVGILGMLVSVFGVLIIRSGLRYGWDWGYFVHQVSMRADFGRTLYTQVEFPYGPVFFYAPIVARRMLSPFHLSLAGGYLAAFAVEFMAGLLMVAYVTNHLPISRQWKNAVFLLLVLGMVPASMGLNYIAFRFAPPLAFLVMADQQRRPWVAALSIFAGAAVCLGLSPEIGFAFSLASFAYAVYRCVTQGRAWILGVIAPVAATAAFLALVGQSYLRMMKLYSQGVMSFPVEPQFYIILFLLGLVWLVPANLARFFRHGRPEAPMLAALYLVSLALLPAAFGRSDSWHIFWNGLSVFLLSTLAISSMRIWKQMIWGTCLTLMFLWMSISSVMETRYESGPVLHSAIAALKGRVYELQGAPKGFEMRSLQTVVGRDPVVTPEEVPLSVEAALRAAGQYTPTFYYFQIAILTPAAEGREIEEFNQSKWALIAKGAPYQFYETPERIQGVLGIRFPYRTRRPIYKIGLRFAQNLAANWTVRGKVGDYLVYENLHSCTGCGTGQRRADGTYCTA